MDRFYRELNKLSSQSLYWRTIKSRLENITKGERRLLGRGFGDFFFIPRKLFPETLPMLHLLGKNHIFLETGVETALRPYSNDFHHVNLRGHDYGQGTIRDYPFEQVYSTSYEIVHPFKMGRVTTYFNRKNVKEASNSCVFCHLVKISLYFDTL